MTGAVQSKAKHSWLNDCVCVGGWLHHCEEAPRSTPEEDG